MNKPTNGSYVFSWQEAEQPSLGEGISRPHAKDVTRMVKLRVRVRSGAPMTVTLPAINEEMALRYAQNRWPDCNAEVLR